MNIELQSIVVFLVVVFVFGIIFAACIVYEQMKIEKQLDEMVKKVKEKK